MANGFKDREKGFENKFQRDQEALFKVTARRNKLLGLWAAEQMKLSEAEAEAYARDVVASDFEEPGDADVVRKVMGDLDARGVGVTEHRLRKEMDRLGTVARAQIEQEAK